MDKELNRFAKSSKVSYTRYADDMSFSSRSSIDVAFSKSVENIILKHGFLVNDTKTHLRTKKQSQKVTGLVVNEFVNVPRYFVRNIRAILHDWKNNGIKEAAKNHFEKHNISKIPEKLQPSVFKKIVVGKIHHVGNIRGKNNEMFLNLVDKIKNIDSSVRIRIPRSEKPIILTEGQSDWKHLKAALDWFKRNNRFKELDVVFNEFQHSFGEGSMFTRICTDVTFLPKDRLWICVFDGDVKQNVSNKKTWFRRYRHNVYSMRLPSNNRSIEFYYTTGEITRSDDKGRRLYINTEFDKDGVFTENADIKYVEHINAHRNNIEKGIVKIVDDNVIGKTGENIALSKDIFAENILDSTNNFSDFNFENFESLFEYVEKIIKST